MQKHKSIAFIVPHSSCSSWIFWFSSFNFWYSLSSSLILSLSSAICFSNSNVLIRASISWACGILYKKNIIKLFIVRYNRFVLNVHLFEKFYCLWISRFQCVDDQSNDWYVRQLMQDFQQVSFQFDEHTIALWIYEVMPGLYISLEISMKMSGKMNCVSYRHKCIQQ